MSNWCYHTYGRWEDQKLVCAVCSEKLDEAYNKDFQGTFPVSELRMANAILKMPFATNYTSTAIRIPTISLEDE